MVFLNGIHVDVFSVLEGLLSFSFREVLELLVVESLSLELHHRQIVVFDLVDSGLVEVEKLKVKPEHRAIVGAHLFEHLRQQLVLVHLPRIQRKSLLVNLLNFLLRRGHVLFLQANQGTGHVESD